MLASLKAHLGSGDVVAALEMGGEGLSVPIGP
jgi:hypothetical protein